MVKPLSIEGAVLESWEIKVVVIVASPTPMIMCQKSIAGTVTAMPPAEANIEETPISMAQAKDPSTIENHEAIKTLTRNFFWFNKAEAGNSLTA